jgi:predicted transcriptional regulator
MKSLLIQLDDQTLRALDRIAPARKRQRSEFIRTAIKRAIRKAEYEAMKKAYQRKPDSQTEADDWANAEEFKL